LSLTLKREDEGAERMVRAENKKARRAYALRAFRTSLNGSGGHRSSWRKLR